MDTLIELIFIPATPVGHLVSAVEMAKLLVARDSRLSITLLLLKHPFDKNPTTAESLSSSVLSERIQFVNLPRDEPPVDMTQISFFANFHESQKPHVRDAVRKISSGGSVRVAGFVLDMFCTGMIDVADEFGVPSYVFFTSGANFLCLMNCMESRGGAEIGDELVVPGFAHPVPKKVMPSVLTDKAWSPMFLNMTRGISRSNGVLINTFEELDPGAIEALSSLDHTKFPPVYPVGPLLNLTAKGSVGEIMEWLDGQPASLVVFLCFGSMGSFGVDQVKEIATALERTGVRFLWSLRRPGEKNEKMLFAAPTDYDDPAEVLPEGFMERTAGIGKVVGWAPQAAVLGHEAVGGFVSHCGWNSTLESLWFGVPMGTWPLHAEQHLNAFTLVKGLGLAMEITMESRRELLCVIGGDSVVEAEKIERGIVKLMERDSDVRKKVKEMSEKSRKSVLRGGSSDTSLSRFINNVIEF